MVELSEAEFASTRGKEAAALAVYEACVARREEAYEELGRWLCNAGFAYESAYADATDEEDLILIGRVIAFHRVIRVDQTLQECAHPGRRDQ